MWGIWRLPAPHSHQLDADRLHAATCRVGVAAVGEGGGLGEGLETALPCKPSALASAPALAAISATSRKSPGFTLALVACTSSLLLRGALLHREAAVKARACRMHNGVDFCKTVLLARMLYRVPDTGTRADQVAQDCYLLLYTRFDAFR